MILRLLLSVLLRRGTCPAAWHHEGVTPGGRYHCVRDPLCDVSYRGGRAYHDLSYYPPGVIEGDLSCGPREIGLVVDQRRVRCAPRSGR